MDTLNASFASFGLVPLTGSDPRDGGQEHGLAADDARRASATVLALLADPPGALPATVLIADGVAAPPTAPPPRPQRDRRPELVYLAGLRPSGRRSMAARLTGVARFCGGDTLETLPWERLRYQHLRAILTLLERQRLAPASLQTTLAALKGVARESWRLEYLTAEEHARIRDITAPGGSRQPAGRDVARGELAALLDACATDPTAAGRRDAALLALLYAGGLRRDELAQLTFADYERGQERLRVIGKGNKERFVPLAAGATAALAAWLLVRGDGPGGLWGAINKGGKIVGTGLSAQAVYTMLRKRADQAGVARLSPHDLRRTFVGDLLDAGADIATVQQLAGHASVTTTARYDRRGEQVKRRAVALLHVPFRAPR